MDAFRQGQQLGEAYRRAEQRGEKHQLESERLQAETEYYRSLTRPEPPAGKQPTQGAPDQLPQYVRNWMVAAQPRMHLYSDFEKVVFAPDAAISDRAVLLMSESPYAADLAYYLATHRAESLAMDQMPILEAAVALKNIEKRLADPQ